MQYAFANIRLYLVWISNLNWKERKKRKCFLTQQFRRHTVDKQTAGCNSPVMCRVKEKGYFAHFVPLCTLVLLHTHHLNVPEAMCWQQEQIIEIRRKARINASCFLHCCSDSSLVSALSLSSRTHLSLWLVFFWAGKLLYQYYPEFP